MKSSEPLRGFSGSRRYTLTVIPPLPQPVTTALAAGRLTHALCLEAPSPALLRDTAADIAQCEMVNDGAYQQMRSVTLGGPVTYRREQLTEAMFRNEISHNLMNKLYRAEIWKGFHFQEGLYHLDAAFMCRLPERCARLSRTDAALYHYNTDGGSITRGRRNMAHVLSLIHI